MRMDGVGKRYGPLRPWVVRDVSAEVPPGQLIRLEGANGAGKSTLLRVAAGITTPTAGRVSDRPSVGYVPERFSGELPMSGREYLLHQGRIRGLRGRSCAAAVDEWLGRLGAADYAGAQLRTLSKGMCQKVAIAQALLARPGLLVLDEAWTGLDQGARATLDAAVAERLADGGRVLFVDHLHEQRRGGSAVSLRWQLADGQLRQLAGPGPASPPPPAAQSTMLIELSGLGADEVPRLACAAAVVSVQPFTSMEGRTVVLAVPADASDQVLREVLGRDGVHVVAVRTGPGEVAGDAP